MNTHLNLGPSFSSKKSNFVLRWLALPLLGLALGLSGLFLYKSCNHKSSLKFKQMGIIEAQSVELSTRLPSIVEAVLVQEGDWIAKDQILFRLKCDDIKIEAEQGAREFQRVQRLHQQGAIPKESFEQVESRYHLIKTKLSWCEIKSPQQGRVQSLLKEVGEFSPIGGKIISIINPQSIWTWVYISQKQLAQVQIGQKVKLIFPELDDLQGEGQIVHLNDQAEFTPRNVQTTEERQRLVYGVKISIPNNNKENPLKAGMTVEAVFQQTNDPAL